MSKRVTKNEELHLALYLLSNRFQTPMDLIKYWAFSGPCIEEHPSIEDYNPKSRWQKLTRCDKLAMIPPSPLPPFTIYLYSNYILYTYIATYTYNILYKGTCRQKGILWIFIKSLYLNSALV